MPKETHTDFEILYSFVASNKRKLRIIITRPRKEGIYPVLFFLQGYECSSIDLADNDNHPYAKLLYGVTGQQFVTVRLEKSGVGDSEGVHCRDTDFYMELENYFNTLKHLQKLRYIDCRAIFLFGYSIGGVIAPLLAMAFPVRGILVFGTVAKGWIEYTIENTRRQLQLAKKGAGEIHNDMERLFCFLFLFAVKKYSPRSLLAKHPEFASTFSKKKYIYNRHYSFFQQLAGINIAEAWTKVNCPALIMWGKGDYVSSLEDHKLIYKILKGNNRSPKTKLIQLDSDHFFRRVTTMENSYLNKHVSDFNKQIIRETTKWCKALTFRKISQ